MYSKKLLSLLLAVALFTATAYSQEPEEGVEEPPMTLSEQIASEGHPIGRDHLEVTYENMKELLRGDWVLLLYTPWTKGSTTILTYLPFLDGATATTAPTLRYAAVDCSLYPEVHTFFPHTGYPTLLLTRNGVIVDKQAGGFEGEALFGFARNAAKKVSSKAAEAPEVVGNKAVDEKIAVVRNTVQECFYKYARVMRDGMDRVYLAAVELEINPALFAGICGAGAVVVIVVVLLVVSLCQSDLDMLEAEKRSAQNKSAQKKKNDDADAKENDKAKAKAAAKNVKPKKNNAKRKQD